MSAQRSGSYHTRGTRRPSYATVAAGRHRARDAAQTSARASSSPERPVVVYAPPETYPSRDIDTAMAGHETASTIRRPGTGTQDSHSWPMDSLRDDRAAYGLSGYEEPAPFFTPSYLRSSRHVQRLRQAHERRIAELQEVARGNQHSHAKAQPPLSTSSSSANLSKLPAAYIHRSVVQDVVERLPPPSVDDDRLRPLPSRWSEDDKMNGLEIMADGTEVRFNGVTKTPDEAASVRSDCPMPKECGIYYFEVTILSRGKDGLIGIGFSSRKANLNRLPGWENDSWAYHGDDGYAFACNAKGNAYGPGFASQDVIGCGVNFRTGTAFFTKNGNYQGQAFNNVKCDRIFPSVGMKKPGEHLRINFGKTPFVFDIDSMVETERENILHDINKTDVSELHPPDDENALIHNLIGQYLAHEGYVETTKAFQKDIHERQQTLYQQSQPMQQSDEEDIHAVNRQRIRRSILDGDIDRALKYTQSYYPRLFDDDRNKDIYFRLRCRKFIEIMRTFTELGTAVSSPTTVTKSVESLGSNGHAIVAVAAELEEQHEEHEHLDTQMELDDQLHRETSRSLEPLERKGNDNDGDMDMDASQELLPPKLSLMKAEEVQSLAVKYGTALRADFGDDPRPEIQNQLTDIFAVVAYPDWSAAPPQIANLFDEKGRVAIAEEVNGAVLVSLGKPSSAALEKVCAQTEALLDETASKTGGAAALVNVWRDFLQD